MRSARIRADILREPAALAALLDRYAGPDGPLAGVTLAGARPVLLLGMGSSQFAAQTAAALLRVAGVDAHVELASAARPFPPSADTLAIGISASGGSAETVEALARHQASARRSRYELPRARAGHAADAALPCWPARRGGIACRSSRPPSRVLTCWPASPARRAAAGGGAAQALVDGRAAWLDELLEVGDGPVDAIAPYERFPALQSALMFREAPRMRPTGCETGDWLHVDLYLTRHPGYRALLFTGSRYDAEVMDVGARAGVDDRGRGQDDRGGRPARSRAGRPPGGGAGRDDGCRARGVRALASSARVLGGETRELAALREAAQRAGLDLADPLGREAELLADLLQRRGSSPSRP